MLLLLILSSFRWRNSPIAAGKVSSLFFRRLRTVRLDISNNALGKLVSAEL